SGRPQRALRRNPRADQTRGRAKRLVLFAVRLGELVRGDVLEELLELADDLLLVHFAVLELDGGLLDHLFGREDGSLGPDGQGNRVGRTRVDLDLGAVLLHGDARVEGVLLQLGDRDANNLRAEL